MMIVVSRIIVERYCLILVKIPIIETNEKQRTILVSYNLIIVLKGVEVL